jgi:hypothetical protein
MVGSVPQVTLAIHWDMCVDKDLFSSGLARFFSTTVNPGKDTFSLSS